MKIAVLGGGKIGSVIARMLKQEHEVHIVDPTCAEFIGTQNYKNFFTGFYCQDFDLIINALPGKIGFDALTKAISSGKNVIDVSFWDYDQTRVDALDKLAKERGVTALIDLGWSPGMTNILIGHAMTEISAVSVDYYVGGLPQEGPYKSPYCVEDSLKFVTEASWWPENIAWRDRTNLERTRCEFERRSLPNFCNPFVYRPSGFRDQVNTMHYYGMFKPENLPHTIKILENEWKPDVDYRDISYMDIYVRGKETLFSQEEDDGELSVESWKVDKTIEYHMVDKYDEETKTTSMARLTAATAITGVRFLNETGIMPHGVISPEEIGQEIQGFHFFWDAWCEAGFKIEEKIIENA